ncbi:MAG: sulfatase-like hydrolase/transferase [Deltaproteobacteria bacterium]|nr:sulfatase-like hydrolase/transferase [Deltaproteobacteria bacterium]
MRIDQTHSSINGKSSWRIFLRAAPPYPSASVATLLAIIIAELSLVAGPIEPVGLAILICLCVFFGAIQGLAWKVVLSLLGKLPRAAQLVFWWLLSLGVGFQLAYALGAFHRLYGPYRNLAIQVVAASCVATASLGFVTSCLQPTRARPSGTVFGWPSAVRLGLGATLLLIALIGFYFDITYYVGIYRTAHTGLRWTTWLSGMFALVLLTHHFPLPRISTRYAVGSMLALAISFAVLSRLHPEVVDTLNVRPWSASFVRLTRSILDFDRDGYDSLFSGDCNDFNPRINPGAREIPGNGVDDNCSLGDAKARPVRAELPPLPSQPSPFDVILITLDSVRPDHLGLYNPAYGRGGRNTSPHLDAWARESIVFERAYASGGWTSISVASMMRGLYPRRLTWTKYYETSWFRLLRKDALTSMTPRERFRQMFPLAFEDPNPTLADLLRRRGMHAAAVVYDGFSRMLSRGVGIENDFDEYLEVETVLARNRHDDSGNVLLTGYVLRRVPTDRRLFLWVHFFGPHSNNETHPGTPLYGPTLVDGYDHEIRYLDSQLARLWKMLEERGTPMVIVIAADHGEVFSDPVRMHGMAIGEEDIRVPLIIRVPGWKPGRVSQVVSLVDLFPTLLALTDTPAPSGIDGVDLAPWARDKLPAEERMLISETWRFEGSGRPLLDLIAGFDGQRKVVLNLIDHTFMLYDQTLLRGTPEVLYHADRDRLARFILQYVEQTGGSLTPVD